MSWVLMDQTVHIICLRRSFLSNWTLLFEKLFSFQTKMLFSKIQFSKIWISKKWQFCVYALFAHTHIIHINTWRRCMWPYICCRKQNHIVYVLFSCAIHKINRKCKNKTYTSNVCVTKCVVQCVWSSLDTRVDTLCCAQEKTLYTVHMILYIILCDHILCWTRKFKTKH